MDLGSGAGIDVFIAAKKGASGRAIGIDIVSKLSHDPYRGAFLLLGPGVAVPESVAVSCGPGCC